MTVYCGDCGTELSCMRNGVLIFSNDLKKVRRADAHKCKKCDKSVLLEYGESWNDAPIESIDLSKEYNLSLHYDHYTALQDRPTCVSCKRIMDFMGDAILLLADEHGHQTGEMYACPLCDYVIYRGKYHRWSSLSNEKKKELEEEYAPNIIKVGVGVIPFLSTIRE